MLGAIRTGLTAAGMRAAAGGGGGYLLQDYPGAYVACSFRDLIGTNPSVARVIRSGDSAEADFTASEITNGTLVDWVTQSGAAPAANGIMKTWYDQSGNDNHLISPYTAPLIVSAGVLGATGGFPHLLQRSNAAMVSTNDLAVAGQALHVFALTHPLGDWHSCFVSTDAGTNAGYCLFSDDSTNTDISGRFTQNEMHFNDGVPVLVTRADLYNALQVKTIISLEYVQNSATDLAIGYRPASPVSWAAFPLSEVIWYLGSKAGDRTGIQSNMNAHYGAY